MIRVLFVDDEPKVLRGLERMLTAVDCDWESEFAAGGREALALLAQRPFDVVVSDMRMPEMDGAALLNEVMRLYPLIVRIVLSGHSDRDLILRSIGATHRYLAKPCDANELRSVVTRAMSLRRFLADTRLRALVSQMSRVPSMPQAYREMMAQLQSPQKSIKELGAIIAQDVGMTAKILHVVNSAFFGLPRQVSDPTQAVCLLGIDVLRALVMTIHIFTEAPQEAIKSAGLQGLWNHSTETGAIAKMVASNRGWDHTLCDHALVAGLLHDAGKLVLAVNCPTQYVEALRRAREEGIECPDAERDVLGGTHAQVGAYLLGLWGLPDPVVEAVAFHHCPSDCEALGPTPLAAVHVANALQHARAEEGRDPRTDRLDMEYLRQLGLAECWPKWHDRFLVGAHA